MSEHSVEKGLPRPGAEPPFSVTYIDPKVCATSHDQWFVMGTVNGDPRDQCGPVAICEYEPSAHALARLLNAEFGPTEPVRKPRRLYLGRLSIYLEPRDVWIGVFVGPDAVYVCPLPLLVFRWIRVTPPGEVTR